ncbi:MAG: Ig-like domain-containing protein [Actinobacteria bacterium]|nr:Ig-like domain-containing protein [Actinomycetota bacterium]
MIRYQNFIPLACYQQLAGATGGTAVNGGGGATLSSQIIAGINAAAASIDTVDLVVSAGCPLNVTFTPPNPPSYGPFSAPVDINFTENVTAPNIVGNYSCTVTAVVDGDPRAEQVINVTVTPGPPNSITLTPPTALNVAGDEHCVTATVTDSFCNVVPGVPVTFAVNGANTAGGTVNTNAAGQATFCYTGTVAGNDTITATAQGGTNPTATAAKTYEAGPPASITLTPPTATNVVDDQHCVTATVKDQFGNVVPGATVNFGTAGSTSATGSGTTDAGGQAGFCYTGPALPGADVITQQQWEGPTRRRQRPRHGSSQPAHLGARSRTAVASPQSTVTRPRSAGTPRLMG